MIPTMEVKRQIVYDSKDWNWGQEVVKIRWEISTKHFSFVSSSNITLGGDEGDHNVSGAG